jgi:hypothetical protein
VTVLNARASVTDARRSTRDETQAAVVALATFVRQRLSDVLTHRAESTPKQVALVIVGAAAPFAPTAHARSRLLRQMHASGLLTERELSQTSTIIGVAR